MKKDYMKPAGSVVAVRVNENIAASASSDSYDGFGLHYTFGADGTTKYIYGSEHAAANSGDPEFDRFYDLVMTYIHGLSACRYDPDQAAE